MPKRKKKIKKATGGFPYGELFKRALDIAKREKLETLVVKCGLPLSWLRKFRGGEIQNPSVNRIETILKTFDAFNQ